MSQADAALRRLEVPPFDPDEGPGRAPLVLVGLLLAFVLIAAAWAAWARLDVAVQARGSVVPPSRLQSVQSLEGGVVEAVLVAPGDRVRRGQVLARLDTADAEAALGEHRQQQLAALATQARTEALLAGTEPRFDPAWQAEAPALIAKEMQLWRDAAREHQAAQAALAEAVRRRRAEIGEAEARVASLRQALQVAEEAYAIEARLLREGASARADALAAQQRLLSLRGELDGVQNSLPRLRAALAEAQAQAAEAEARTRAQWGAQRTEAATRVGTLAASQGARQARVDRRELVAPVAGVVNRVLLTTRGAVANPGQALLEIVPDEARLTINVRVAPADIGFVRVGQTAQVRVLAYDAATHGQMRAEVERVGADAVQDEQGQAYFEVQLGAERDQLQLHGRPLPLGPGMPVEVGIVTGERSVLQYLLKPVLRGVQGALQER